MSDNANPFAPAVRSAKKAKIALHGPSHSGKTYSGLLLARGIVGNEGRIAVIDTENNSASLYAGKPGIGSFDTLCIEPPYTTEKYISAIKAAVANEYDILIIDSISHEWAGEGGITDQKDKIDAANPSGNSWTSWGKVTPLHKEFINWLLHSKIHLIATMRVKQSYQAETNERGKIVPVKIGLQPIQRDDVEYEFDTVLNFDIGHNCHAVKDRSEVFNQREGPLTTEDGELFREWLDTAEDAPVNVYNPEPEQRKQAAQQQSQQQRPAQQQPQGNTKSERPRTQKQMAELLFAYRRINYSDTFNAAWQRLAKMIVDKLVANKLGDDPMRMPKRMYDTWLESFNKSYASNGLHKDYDGHEPWFDVSEAAEFLKSGTEPDVPGWVLNRAAEQAGASPAQSDNVTADETDNEVPAPIGDEDTESPDADQPVDIDGLGDPIDMSDNPLAS